MLERMQDNGEPDVLTPPSPRSGPETAFRRKFGYPLWSGCVLEVVVKIAGDAGVEAGSRSQAWHVTL